LGIGEAQSDCLRCFCWGDAMVHRTVGKRSAFNPSRS
jgi:hypothetical protein